MSPRRGKGRKSVSAGRAPEVVVVGKRWRSHSSPPPEYRLGNCVLCGRLVQTGYPVARYQSALGHEGWVHAGCLPPREIAP